MSATPRAIAACVAHAPLFQNPALEETASGQEHIRLAASARAVCHGCPLLQQCLTDAVVRHDVAGFVAGTTPAQRRAIRARLGVTITPDNLDTLAGVLASGRPIDRDEVLRLRAANPSETLEQLAMRLGCSTSTVKRHLRKVRAAGEQPRPVTAPAPSVQAVWDAATAVLGRNDLDVAA